MSSGFFPFLASLWRPARRGVYRWEAGPCPLSGRQAALTRSLGEGPLARCQLVAVLNKAAGTLLCRPWCGQPRWWSVSSASSRSRGHARAAPGFLLRYRRTVTQCVFHPGLSSVEGVRSGSKVCPGGVWPCTASGPCSTERGTVGPTGSLFLWETRGRVYGGPSGCLLCSVDVPPSSGRARGVVPAALWEVL